MDHNADGADPSGFLWLAYLVPGAQRSSSETPRFPLKGPLKGDIGRCRGGCVGLGVLGGSSDLATFKWLVSLLMGGVTYLRSAWGGYPDLPKTFAVNSQKFAKG